MYQEIIEALKQAEGYVSGEALGEKLCVSRTAIWKGIQKLKEQGYAIEAVSHKGYRLLPQGELYNAMEIKQALSTKILGREVFFAEEIDSTNTWIRRLAAEEKPEGTLTVAEQQTGGKGRRGKAWVSERGTSVYMSVLLRPALTPPETPLLTLLAGLAVCEGIRAVTGLSPEIKWPNDVLIQGKKVCGILTELDGEIEQVNFVVIGIGINTNIGAFSEELKEIATSLQIESGKQVSRIELIKAVTVAFEKRYLQYCREGTFAPFLEEYKERCVNIGKRLHVLGKTSFHGIGRDITPEGELVVEKENGTCVVVFSGEVSIRGEA